MPTAEKEAVVSDLADLFTRSTGIYLTDFTGLDVPEVTQLRQRLRDEGVTYRVVKNRLAKLAAEKAGLKELRAVMSGPTGLAATDDDPIAPVRVLTAFSKESQGRPAIKVGLVDGQVYVDEQLDRLASLPSREVLLAQVVWTVQSPMTGLVHCLGGLLQKLVLVLNAVADKKGEAGEEA